MPFEEVDYWPELCAFMDWTKTHVYSTFHICWGAQAALYHHYGIPKYPLPQKMFGVFEHQVLEPTHPLVRGFDGLFSSRRIPAIQPSVTRTFLSCPQLTLLATSEEAGAYLIASESGRQFLSPDIRNTTGKTLAGEYFRDVNKGLPIEIPRHYFQNDDPKQNPLSLARPCQPAVFQLAELFCVPDNTV